MLSNRYLVCLVYWSLDVGSLTSKCSEYFTSVLFSFASPGLRFAARTTHRLEIPTRLKVVEGQMV